MTIIRKISILLSLPVLLACPELSAQDWNQWRGPGRNGIDKHFTVPDSWPEQLRRVWAVPVGTGLSSPVIQEARVFLLTREDENEVVTARSLETGELLWKQSYSAPFSPNQQATSPQLFPVSRGFGPFATPAVSAGALVTLGVDRTLSVWEPVSGKLRWRQQLLPVSRPTHLSYVCPPCGMECDHQEYTQGGKCPNPQCPLKLTPKGLETSANYDGTRGNYYGAAASPLILGDRVFIQAGNQDHSELVAFDLSSGKEVWKWEGPGVSSSSPVIAPLGGVRQLVVLNRTSLDGITLDDGRSLWSHPVQSNAQIVTPVVWGELVIFGLYRLPIQAVQVEHKGAQWQVEPIWENSEATIFVSTPVIVQDTLFGFSFARRGSLFALDPDTGKVLWQTQGREGTSASLVSTGSTLLVLQDSGELKVVKADPREFRLLHSYMVSDSPTWAHLVPVGSHRFLVKNETTLTLFEVP